MKPVVRPEPFLAKEHAACGIDVQVFEINCQFADFHVVVLNTDEMKIVVRVHILLVVHKAVDDSLVELVEVRVTHRSRVKVKTGRHKCVSEN